MTTARVPIFIYPSELTFYTLSRETHKQLLTLYNPYDFPARFQILSNGPDKYAVLDSTGTIAPHSSLDIVVRHKMPTVANCNVTDKFMIVMEDIVTKQKLGKRYLGATLINGEKEHSIDDSLNQYKYFDDDRLLEEPKNVRNVPKRDLLNRPRTGPPSTWFYVLLFLATIIAFLLLLPTVIEPQHTNLPDYMHLTLAVKGALFFGLGTIFACLVIILTSS